ncbi:hypothetical protein [Pontibacter ruber]|uniref:DUF2938 family protein n=1 Tax=Pontibacter ruber TaxID=1343895 RepID=A0ABW5CXQ1_9BACT|nr:hypothetical protein [Pontibacter ruber]
MKLLHAILAGLAGTAAMTAFLYLLSFATHRVMKVVMILGTMLTGRTGPDGSISEAGSTKVVGNAAHYLMGIVFAIGYLALWDSEVGLPTAGWGLLFGLGHGLLAMVLWYLFLMVYPKPPRIPLRTYLITLIFAHIVYGFVVAYTFYLLEQPDYTFWQ